MKVTNVKTQDIRFPTSKDNLGSDAVHVDCDYKDSSLKEFDYNKGTYWN